MASTGTTDTMGNKTSTLEGAKVGTHGGAEHLTKALTFAVKNASKEGFRVELDGDNNLYKWQVHLFDFPATCNLAYDKCSSFSHSSMLILLNSMDKDSVHRSRNEN
jgi:hypothetical protein